MNHKIEPGMLCMVIGGHNAGRECTVIRRLKKYENIPEINGMSLSDSWWVKGPHIEAEWEGKLKWLGGYGAETSLMPLANGQDDTIVKSEVTEYVAG